MHADLATFQRDFAAAILSGAESEFDRWPGFAVYRNNSAMAAIEALAGAYPTVRKILGEFGFRKLALDHFRSAPPENPVLASYDERFVARPDLETISARFPYLSDIARIDRMQIESHLAHDPVDEAGLDVAMIADADWATIVATLHPATRYRWFTTPAPLAWLALRQNAIEGVVPPPRGASGILLTRPFGAVEAGAIDRIEYLLLEELAQGASVAEAAMSAAEEQPEENIGAGFKRLLDSGAIHHFEKKELN
jgi:hypothetical protein